MTNTAKRLEGMAVAGPLVPQQHATCSQRVSPCPKGGCTNANSGAYAAQESSCLSPSSGTQLLLHVNTAIVNLRTIGRQVARLECLAVSARMCDSNKQNVQNAYARRPARTSGARVHCQQGSTAAMAHVGQAVMTQEICSE